MYVCACTCTCTCTCTCACHMCMSHVHVHVHGMCMCMYAEEGERDGCTIRPSFFPRYGGGVRAYYLRVYVLPQHALFANIMGHRAEEPPL